MTRAGVRRSLLGLAILSGSGFGAASESETPPGLRQEGVLVRVADAALLLGEQRAGELRTALAATPRVVAEGRYRVELRLEVEGALVLEGAGDTPSVDWIVYALEAGGSETGSSGSGRSENGGSSVAATAGLRLTLDAELHEETLSGTGLRLGASFELGPGTYRLRSLTRSSGGALGLDGSDLTLPAAGEPSAPLAVRVPGAPPWLCAGEARSDEPPVRPLVAVGKPLLVTAPGPATDGSGTAEFALLRDDGRLESRIAEATDDGAWRIDTSGLAPGRYGLRRAATGTEEPATGSAREVWVVADDGVEAWSRVRDPTREAGPGRSVSGVATAPRLDAAARAAAAGEVPEGLLVERVERSWRAVAAAAATEGAATGGEGRGGEAWAEAVEALRVLDLAAGPGVALAALERMEARWLAAEPGALLPLQALHQRSALRLLGVGVLDLGDAHGERARELARRVARGGDEARRAAADGLAATGGDLLALQLLGRAESWLAEAERLWPGHDAAILSLGALLEKQSRWGEAVSVLRRWVDAADDRSEAALRLALDLGRSGRSRDARERLQTLVEEGRPDWVASVATQELARSASREGRPDEAGRLLRAGLERWPRHPALPIQLAALLDAQGLEEESLELLRRLPETPAIEGEADRFRYNRWPRAGLRDARAAFAAACGGHWEALTRALAAGELAR